jgi:hypothetical protein
MIAQRLDQAAIGFAVENLVPGLLDEVRGQRKPEDSMFGKEIRRLRLIKVKEPQMPCRLVEQCEVHCLKNPFQSEPDFHATSFNYNIYKLLGKSRTHEQAI